LRRPMITNQEIEAGAESVDVTGEYVLTV
jgi:hypothetical protein